MIDPIVEQNLIIQQVATLMSPTLVIEDDNINTQYVNGVMAEYVFVDFGTPVATADGRSIAGEERQPFSIRVSVAYVAGSRSAARAGASRVAGLVGFVPNTNSGPLRLVGGGSYTLQDDSTKPLKFVSETYFVFVDNLSADN